jgi:hypothetical protein
LTAEQVESLLRDDPMTPAFGAAGYEPLAYLRIIQDRAEAALPHLVLLPKPVEKQVYQRKRPADRTPLDEAWLSLSLLKKIARVDAVATAVLRERLSTDVSLSINGLHDDFRIIVKFSGLAVEQIPTAIQLIQDRLHAEVHPDLVVIEQTEEPS